MEKRVLAYILIVLGTCSYSAFSQEKQFLNGTVRSIPSHNLPATQECMAEHTASPLASAEPLPMWTYRVRAYNGKEYIGQILGNSPKCPESNKQIPTQIVPLVITITDSNGTVVYDPTQPDSCVPGNKSGIDVITESPIFTDHQWVMNGVDVGKTQYEDANLRAEFWSDVKGDYHVTLKESTLDSQALSFGNGGSSGPGSNYPPSVTGNCEDIGVVKTGDMDAAIQALIAGPLAGQVNIGTFPLFLTKNVVMNDTDTELFGGGCCTLGFHSSFQVGSHLQLYGPFEVDTAEAFGKGYTDVMSHEVGEGIHDPSGNNATPAWGNQGQQPGCQDNFEDGDPLSGGGIPPVSKEWVVKETNGLTYDLQELAFFNWFYGGKSLGTGGFYSNNGTFKGHAKPCPPGGTY